MEAAIVGSVAPRRATTIAASVPEVVTSPDRSLFVSEVPPENAAILPLTGEPVAVKVPDELPQAPDTVVSNPPVEACTQCPVVNDAAVTVAATRLPLASSVAFAVPLIVVAPLNPAR